MFDTNQAMLQLPPEYRGRAFTWSEATAGASANAPAGQNNEMTRDPRGHANMEQRLQKAVIAC